MFDNPEKIFTIEQKEALDTCPACQEEIDRSEINITAQYIYVKIEAPINDPIAHLIGMKVSQVIYCLAHDECLDEYTTPESKGIYNLKPEKYQEVLARGR